MDRRYSCHLGNFFINLKYEIFSAIAIVLVLKAAIDACFYNAVSAFVVSTEFHCTELDGAVRSIING